MALTNSLQLCAALEKALNLPLALLLCSIVQQSARHCVHWAAFCCMWAARRSATQYSYAEDFLPTVTAQLSEVEEVPPTLRQLLDYDVPSEVSRVILRLMRRLLCRRSQVAEAAAAEREWLIPWVNEWLDLEELERRSLSTIVVSGFVSLPVQVQACESMLLCPPRYRVFKPFEARHLALLIDAHLAHLSVLAAQTDEIEESAQWERIHRGARIYRTSLAALAALSDSELDSIGQVAVAEAEKVTSPITMARVVLHLSPARRRQLMDILVQENVLEDASALRLFRALSALESLLGAEALDAGAVLTGMDAAASATAGVMGLGSGVIAAGASVMDSFAMGATSSMDALSSWSYGSLFGVQDAETHECGEGEPEVAVAGLQEAPSSDAPNRPASPDQPDCHDFF
eukprot:symbB.v1.2.002778.t1/scaffold141.1/size300911/29